MDKITTIVKAENLSFSYDSRISPIFSGLNFIIKDEEFVSVLGKSGCGKTTLASILAGYLKPTSGRILIKDQSISRPGRNRILVNQENDLFVWMTTIQNISLVTNNKKDIISLLKLAGLYDSKDKYPKALSGGMKKRLSLVRALAVNPDFLILDEPFSSLDHNTKSVLESEIDKIISSNKKSTLLVTHDLDEAVFLSDRVIILGGNPTEVKKTIRIDAAHPRSQEFRNSSYFNSIKQKINESY